MAGFLAFGCVAFLADGERSTNAGDGHTHWYYLALAAMLGLVSKDPDKLLWGILEKALSVVRKDDKDK
jgi:hypothetical protein